LEQPARLQSRLKWPIAICLELYGSACNEPTVN
jgi:hypothetical protein